MIITIIALTAALLLAITALVRNKPALVTTSALFMAIGNNFFVQLEMATTQSYLIVGSEILTLIILIVAVIKSAVALRKRKVSFQKSSNSP